LGDDKDDSSLRGAGSLVPDHQSNSSPSSSSSSDSSLSSDSSSDADPMLLLFDYLFDSDNSHQDDRNNLPAQPPQREKRRHGAKGVAFYVDETGVRRVLPPRMSSWYSMYIENPDTENNGFKKKF
jgi:hypothetical protein